MGGSGGLRLGEDSVSVGRRRGSAAWGLGRLGPVTLRPTEAWVGEHGVTESERVTKRERG